MKKKEKINEILADEKALKIEMENYEATIKTSYNKPEENQRKIKKKKHKLEMLLLNTVNLSR
jgi:hypothetical protein